MSPSQAQASPLDTAVLTARSALLDLGVRDPLLLILFGTGLPAWSQSDEPVAPAGFRREGAIELRGLPGVPQLWQAGELVHGTITTAGGPVPVWLLEDPSLDAPLDSGERPFERGFFCWLAATAGAQLLLHTAAGGPVEGSTLETGDLCLVHDYLNLSGSSPLLALGPSKLGPLFPDLTQLFSPALLAIAGRRAEALGITAREAVLAAAAPVSLATPAERSWYKTAGAEVWAQGLAGPYLAAAHAGLEVLSIVALIGQEHSAASSGPDVQAMLLASDGLAPGLDALVQELVIPAAEAALAAKQELA